MENVIVSHNVASFRGGGLRFYSVNQGTLKNVSILDNQVIMPFGQGAGLLVIQGTKQFSLRNSLLANNNIADNKPSDCYGKIDSLGHNFLGASGGCTWQAASGDLLPGPEEKLDPQIHWLPSQTVYTLAPTSPLLGNADPSSCSAENCQTGAMLKRAIGFNPESGSRTVFVVKPRHFP